jgi:hypothetical protein
VLGILLKKYARYITFNNYFAHGYFDGSHYLIKGMRKCIKLLKKINYINMTMTCMHYCLETVCDLTRYAPVNYYNDALSKFLTKFMVDFLIPVATLHLVN